MRTFVLYCVCQVFNITPHQCVLWHIFHRGMPHFGSIFNMHIITCQRRGTMRRKKRLSPVYWSAAAAALHRCNYAWDVGGAVQRAAMNLSVMMREHSRDGIKQQVQCTLNFHSLCFSDWNKAKEVNRANIRIVSNHLVIHACELFQDICDKPVSKPTLPCLWLEHFI